MKPDFDYQSLSRHFIHCLNGQCKRADECLRHLVALRVPPDRELFTIVSPAYAAIADKDCRYFKADCLKLFARGMTHLLDSIPHKDAVVIKRQMLDYFGRTHFYRLWRKEVLFDESQQEYVRQLFKQRGLSAVPTFDEYVEMYE